MTNRAESEQRATLFTINDSHGSLVHTDIIFLYHFFLCFLIPHLKEKLSDLKWQGAYAELKKICHKLGDERIPERIPRWR